MILNMNFEPADNKKSCLHESIYSCRYYRYSLKNQEDKLNEDSNYR